MIPDVVVTGASGFIGRWVCEELLRRGAVVYGLTRSNAKAIAGVRYLKVATYDQARVPPGAVCIHLAGGNLADNVATNVRAEFDESIGLAKKIATGSFTRVVFISSALVYGYSIQTPRREDEPISPGGAYATMKAAAEEIFLSHGHTVARLANVYGPGMSAVNVLSDVLQQVPGSGDIQVRDVDPIRDYIYVSDIARGLAALALYGTEGGIFNLGTGIGTSVGQLVACIAEQAGEEGRRVVSYGSDGRRSILILDPGKTAAALGWQADIPLAEGLKELIENRISMVSQKRYKP